MIARLQAVARSRYAIAIVEQGLFSILNLGVTLLLGRLLAPEQFGAAVVWFAVAYVLVSVQNAVSISHVQVLPTGAGTDPARLETERIMLAATAVFLVLVAVIVAIAAAWLKASGSPFGVMAAVLFVPAYLLQQYVRLLCFSRGEALTAAHQTGLVLVLAVVLLGLGYVGFSELSAEHVLGLLGAAYGVIGLLGLWRACRGLIGDTLRLGHFWTLLKRYIEFARHSAWIFLGVISTELLARFYVFAAGAAYGPATLALLSFSQTFLRPVPLLASSWSLAARGDLVARRDRQDGRGFSRMLILAAVGGLAVSALWSAAVFAGWPLITDSLFEGKYAEAQWMLPLWGLSVAFGFVQVVVSTGLQVLKAFKPLAIANAAASLVAAGGVLWLMQHQGASGAILGTALGQALEAAAMLAVLVVMVRRLNRASATA